MDYHTFMIENQCAWYDLILKKSATDVTELYAFAAHKGGSKLKALRVDFPPLSLHNLSSVHSILKLQSSVSTCRYYGLYTLRPASLHVDTIVSTRWDTTNPPVCVREAKFRPNFLAFACELGFLSVDAR